ncbi:unnamed protein product [Schistosoma curassoni]|uniref:Uncharacterized protein n=1 Tax=Schistosoma curassoni TaxID=6186 RepID=A0A183KM90_9TREM|nr:unnamed protein product [Schistosoma curassoni]
MTSTLITGLSDCDNNPICIQRGPISLSNRFCTR